LSSPASNFFAGEALDCGTENQLCARRIAGCRAIKTFSTGGRSLTEKWIDQIDDRLKDTAQARQWADFDILEVTRAVNSFAANR
jgi:hypothetical protein